MDCKRLREMNEDIILVSSEKIKKALAMKQWDEESFLAMTKALQNLHILDEMSEEKEKVIEYTASISNAHSGPKTRVIPQIQEKPNMTEFESIIMDIAKKDSSLESMQKLTTVLSEHFEDMRILNKRAYDNAMKKLRGLM